MVRDFMMKKFPVDMDTAASASLASAIGALEHQDLLPASFSPSSSNTDPSSLEAILSTLRNSANGSIYAPDNSLSPTSTGLGGKRSLKLMSQAQKAKLVPFKANDPMVMNRSQWYHERVQNNLAWLLTTGKFIFTIFRVHDVSSDG